MAPAVAIITARAGSKRIPKKNIKPFAGAPIIKYSIEAALFSDCFQEVMVSTDDTGIAEIAVSYKAKVPFFRSKKTSDDCATTADVINEVLLEYQKNGQYFEYCCCLYPTAPFTTSEKIIQGFKLLKEKKADSVIPVVRFSHPIQRALKIKNGKLKMIHPEYIHVRSQDLITAYHDVGQFYWLKVKPFLKHKKLFMENTVPMEVSEMEVQDIDDENDWKQAELKYKILKSRVSSERYSHEKI
ncbi:MAG: pseudaminic acid cytidylyltransferase [Candidatus Aureabacteria bacterium]|nr:pseudaminic acid cytidylyltransferase [Candidatus Auribacterota bacterium]